MRILRNDPSSQIAAAIEGWDHPITREALALFDVYDVTVAANSDKRKRPKPHPGRPFKLNAATQGERQRGDAGGRSREEVIRILNSLGHNLPV